MKPRKDPSITSIAYNQMMPAWQKVETLLSGTDAMREAGQMYLPKHENEKDRAYRNRLRAATLFNMTALTLDSWVGRPFSDPVNVGEDVPAPVVELLDDVDLQGNDVTTFSRHWFREGLAKAFCHVMVEMPEIDLENRTIADDIREGVRPYWTLIKPENMIFATGMVINGQEVLTHVRIKEEEIERVEFEERQVCRIRVFDLVQIEDGELGVEWSLWRENEKGEYVLEKPPARMGIDRIPIVTFYADRHGLMLGKSPLEDLSDLNIAHWQSSSDQRNILRVSRFPLLAASGVDSEDGVVEVGPNRMLSTTAPDGKFYYVEHSGKSINAGRQDLLDLEEQMASYGAEYLKKRPGNMTATARALDSAEATSPLQDAAIRFQDALQQVLYLTARWLGIEEMGLVEVATDFGPEDANSADLSALSEARKLRDLSREDYLEELKRRGALREDFDMEENLRRLEAEEGAFMGGAAQVDIDPEGEDDEPSGD